MLVMILFYAFSAVLVAAALGVITTRNPVYSALCLVLAFFTSACIWILIEAEFLAIVLVLVYVGAVMVLFLFVVMMLDVDFARLKSEFARYLPLGLVMALVILVQLAVAFGAWEPAGTVAEMRQVPIAENTLNTHALGLVLYDRYLLAFQTAGLILLVAMIGAILLTLRHRRDIKRQDVLQQMWRDPAKAMRMTDPKPGQGL